MAHPTQIRVGRLLLNSRGYRYSSLFPNGNRPAAPYNLLFKEDFSSGTVGNPYPGFHTSSIYANDHPFLGGKCLRVNLGAMTPPICGGSMNYGGRLNLPQAVPYGSRIWYSLRLFHPVTQTWGYCYDPGDNAEAVACGKESDGNEWRKFMVLAPTTGTARIYLEPKSVRRNVAQLPGTRLYSEASQQPYINTTMAWPTGRWYTLQMEVFLNDTTGYMRYWVDDQLVGGRTAGTVTAGNSIAQWGIGDYWNGCPYTDGQPNRQHFWVKDVMIATDAPGFTAPTDTDGNGNIFIGPNRRPADFL